MDALTFAQELVRFPSVSRSSNADVSDWVESTLRGLNFETERIEYADAHGVRKVNIVGKKGRGLGGIAYFGHTDVVPADTWSIAEHGPFEPTVRDGRLYGRGSCDMKGSVACMLAAAGSFAPQELQSPIYVTCTADEEIGYGGAAAVAARSRLFAEMVQGNSRGVIGEPTCLEVVYAHKGVAGFRAVSHGRAAHSSTDKGINANLKMIPFLQEMLAIHHETAASPAWKNPEFDPPGISWNIGINDFTLATNITPARSVCTVYFRPMPGMSADALFDRARRAADACGIEFQATVRGDPVYVDPRSPFIQEVLRLAGKSTPRTVSYGTDGAKLTSLKQLVVLGPGDIAQAHTDDEWIALEALEQGTDLYRRLIRHWCG